MLQYNWVKDSEVLLNWLYLPRWSLEKTFEVNIWMTVYFAFTTTHIHVSLPIILEKCMAELEEKKFNFELMGITANRLHVTDLPFWMIRIVDVQGLMAAKNKLVKDYTCYLAHMEYKKSTLTTL